MRDVFASIEEIIPGMEREIAELPAVGAGNVAQLMVELRKLISDLQNDQTPA